MQKLVFTWKAIFKDSTTLNQFNEDGSENLFKLVKERLNDLAYFILTDEKGHTFTVDLINGIIAHNNSIFLSPAVEKRIKNNLRLIFFRRHKVFMNEELIEKKHIITYFLGMQWNNENNENRNIILQINENGDFIIEGK